MLDGGQEQMYDYRIASSLLTVQNAVCTRDTNQGTSDVEGNNENLISEDIRTYIFDTTTKESPHVCDDTVKYFANSSNLQFLIQLSMIQPPMCLAFTIA